MMIREYGIFMEEFHRNIIPSEEEQNRYRQKRDMQMILERLDRIPKNSGFSLAKTNDVSGRNIGNESILMPQVRMGLRNGEFTFYLQPRYDLNTHKIIGAEALVRWNHKKLGLVSPSVFIPTLEANGYIIKLDQYIWEEVCKTVRRWIDAGLRPVPVSVNLSKTDILAIEIADFFTEMVHKYKLPPRSLEIEIAENAYIHTPLAASEVENALRQSGFRVIIDGFTGDYMALMNKAETVNADALKLDLRFMNEQKGNRTISSVLDQASKMKINLIAEGIENMEQMTVLRKNGCTEGQGFYLSRPISIEEFEKELMRNEP
jgi:EAL domain-containing protein (putative c-di-GMP-specific phosphodiesterase class I)